MPSKLSSPIQLKGLKKYNQYNIIFILFYIVFINYKVYACKKDIQKWFNTFHNGTVHISLPTTTIVSSNAIQNLRIQKAYIEKGSVKIPIQLQNLYTHEKSIQYKNSILLNSTPHLFIESFIKYNEMNDVSSNDILIHWIPIYPNCIKDIKFFLHSMFLTNSITIETKLPIQILYTEFPRKYSTIDKILSIHKIRCTRDSFFKSIQICALQIPVCGYMSPIGEPSLAIVSLDDWKTFYPTDNTINNNNDSINTLQTIQKYILYPYNLLFDKIVQSTTQWKQKNISLQGYNDGNDKEILNLSLQTCNINYNIQLNIIKQIVYVVSIIIFLLIPLVVKSRPLQYLFGGFMGSFGIAQQCCFIIWKLLPYNRSRITVTLFMIFGGFLSIITSYKKMLLFFWYILIEYPIFTLIILLIGGTIGAILTTYIHIKQEAQNILIYSIRSFSILFIILTTNSYVLSIFTIQLLLWFSGIFGIGNEEIKYEKMIVSSPPQASFSDTYTNIIEKYPTSRYCDPYIFDDSLTSLPLSTQSTKTTRSRFDDLLLDYVSTPIMNDDTDDSTSQHTTRRNNLSTRSSDRSFWA